MKVTVRLFAQQRQLTGWKTNELELRITNTQSKGAIQLSPAGGGKPATKFVLSADVDSDWALANRDQVKAIDANRTCWAHSAPGDGTSQNAWPSQSYQSGTLAG